MSIPKEDRYVPPPVWSDLIKSSGMERWEAFRIAHLNQQAADAARTEARSERDYAETLKPGGLKWGRNKDWQRLLKRAIAHERSARIRSERAEMWRRIAKEIPYPQILS